MPYDNEAMIKAVVIRPTVRNSATTGRTPTSAAGPLGCAFAGFSERSSPTLGELAADVLGVREAGNGDIAPRGAMDIGGDVDRDALTHPVQDALDLDPIERVLLTPNRDAELPLVEPRPEIFRPLRNKSDSRRRRRHGRQPTTLFSTCQRYRYYYTTFQMVIAFEPLTAYFRNVEFKDRVKKLRLAVGLRQDQVADQSGGRIPRPVVAKLENGRNQGRSVAMMQGLATAYGVRSDQMEAYAQGDMSLKEFLALRANQQPVGQQPVDQQPRRYGEIPTWAEAEAEARLQGGARGYEFMGARMMPILAEPNVDPLTSAFVNAVTWFFRHTAKPKAIQAAIEAEDAEQAAKAGGGQPVRTPSSHPTK